MFRKVTVFKSLTPSYVSEYYHQLKFSCIDDLVSSVNRLYTNPPHDRKCKTCEYKKEHMPNAYKLWKSEKAIPNTEYNCLCSQAL